MMKFEILTLFPEAFPGLLGMGIIGRALESGLFEIETHNPRDFTHDKHRSVDDYAFGGGPGMLMKPEPLCECLDAMGSPAPFRILLSPQGIPFTQDLALEIYTNHSRISLLCGRYEGVDERIRDHVTDLDLSIGNYVLAGGELAAMVVIETIARLIPGVVGDHDCVTGDSLSDGLLKCPQYTRPAEYRGWKVPEILLSGNHGRIDQWRKEQSLARTKSRRPDLFTCNNDSNDGN